MSANAAASCVTFSKAPVYSIGTNIVFTKLRITFFPICPLPYLRLLEGFYSDKITSYLLNIKQKISCHKIQKENDAET